MAASAQDKTTSQRSDVFISYSRKDREFVRRLEEELQRRGREAWVDWEGIRPAEEFMQAIFPAIEGTDTFIFVLSPDSVTSEICGKELAHAVSHNKRMIPIMARDTDAKAVPEPLAKLNWVFARDADSFEAAADFLISALDTDLGWVRAHTRLTTRAVEWEAKGKNDSFALRGVDLRAAEQWLTVAGAEKERQPTALQTEYIIASRRAATRRQRITFAAIVFGAIVATVLGIATWLQHSRAVEQEGKARRESSQSEFARAAAWLDAGDSAEALRNLSNALQWDPTNDEAATQLIHLLGQRQWPCEMASQRFPFPIEFIEQSHDGRRIFVAGGRSSAFGEGAPQLAIIDGETFRSAGPIALNGLVVLREIKVRPAGDRVLVGADPGGSMLIDADSGRILKHWIDQPPQDSAGWFSNDGKWAFVWQQRNLETSLKPAHWLDVVSAEDGTPRPGLAKIPLLGKPIAAMMLADEIRLLQGDGSLTVQGLEGRKPGAVEKRLTIEEVGGIKGGWFAPEGHSLITVRPNGIDLLDIPQPTKAKQDANASAETSSYGTSVPFPALSRDVPYRLNVRFESPEEFTVVADYRPSEGTTAREGFGFAVRLQRQESAPPKSLATWSGSFAPVSLLPSGIVVARDTTAMVAPFGKGNFSGPIRHAAEITALCTIADGVLASGSADGEIKLWRLPPPAFTSTPPMRPAPARESRELLARSRDPAAVELWAEWERVPDAPADPNAGPVKIDGKQQLFVMRAGKPIEINLGSPPVARSISNAALTADGKRAVFSGEAEIESPEDVSGAWVFSTDHPDQLSNSLSHCSWAGFTPDGRYVLTVHNGQLVFWEESPPGPGGRVSFKPTGQVLPQSGMKSAVLAEGGSHLATWSSTGEVIVWDTAKWAPVHRFTSDPLWNTGDWSNCAPALSRDGRRLATAYDRAFVIWDITSGKRLSDPIYCPARLERLAFVGPGSAQIEATLSTDDERSQMSTLTWGYADVTDALDEKGVKELGDLARAVAAGDWVAKAPELVAQKDCPRVVAALLEHFAVQARALREKSVTSAPSVPK